MDNVQLHQLMFNRSWATFDNFFPEPVLNQLINIVNTGEQIDYGQEFRTSITNVDNLLVNEFFKNRVPQLIYEWTKEQVELVDWQFWIDYPGLAYTPHTDIYMFKKHEHHVQVYLNDGLAELGTRVHNIKRAQVGQAAYKLNSGIYLNTAQTIIHSVSQVPKYSIRKSVRARYKSSS